MNSVNETAVKQAMASECAKEAKTQKMSNEEKLIYAIQNADVDLFYDNWREVDADYQDKAGNTFWHWLALAEENPFRVTWAECLDVAHGYSNARMFKNNKGLTPVQLLKDSEKHLQMAVYLTPQQEQSNMRQQQLSSQSRETLKKAPTPISNEDLQADAQTHVRSA